MILLGHNGAGKSTLINYLLGFYPSLNDHPFLEHFSSYIQPLHDKSIGYAPEAATLDGNLSAYDYLYLMAGLKSLKPFNPETLLEKVALDVPKERVIRKFSKGMKQKLLLACAILGDPDVIVLDEPTSGLDPFVQHEIEQILIDLKAEHDFIVSTHSLPLAWALEEEVWIIKQGKIVYRGRPESESALKGELLLHRPEMAV